MKPFVSTPILNAHTTAPGFKPCETCNGVGSVKAPNDGLQCPTCNGAQRVAA